MQPDVLRRQPTILHRTPSIGVTVPSVVSVVIIVASIAFVASECVHVGLIENHTEQVVMNAARICQRVLCNVDFDTSPLDHEDETSRSKAS